MGDQGSPTGPLPKDVAERVLKRAADLTPVVGQTGTWADEGISEQVLIEAAAEVGIAPQAVQRALAVERLGDPRPAHWSDRLLGPTEVAGDIETNWSPDDTLRLIDAWLVQAHHLRRDRTRPDGGVWRRRTDMAAKVQRTLRGLNGEAGLGEVEEVSAIATAIDGSHSLARVTVNRASNRSTVAAASGTVTVLGVAGAVALGVVVTPALVATAPLAAVGGVLVARTGRRGARATEHEVERLLDEVRAGNWPRRVSDDVRQVFRTRRTR